MKRKESGPFPAHTMSVFQELAQPYGVNMKALIADHFGANHHDDRWISVARAVEISGLSKWTMYRAIHNGEIEFRKLSRAKSGRLLIREESLRRWIESRPYGKWTASHERE